MKTTFVDYRSSQFMGNLLSNIIVYQFIIISMLRYSVRNYHRLAFKQNYQFSVRTVGDFEFHEFDSFTKVLINKPKALNALNLDMVRVLNDNIEAMEKAKAVWFEGAGGKAFCAGGDVKSLFDKDAKPSDRITFFREEFTTDYKLANMKTLQIANWDGIVMGGGFGITSMAPFRIATENSMYAMPEAKLGFYTDICSCYILSRLKSNIGFYLGMTGARLKGQDIYISGLANYYVPRQSIQPLYNQIKQALPSSTSPKQTITQILNKYHKPSGRKQLPDEDKINSLFSLKDFREIYRQASAKNDPFHTAVTKNLNEQCPPAIGVIHRLISTAKDKSYRQLFLRDFKLAQHYANDPNFAQGVRTVLVQRGSTPNWSHKSILDVTDADVDKYFNFPKQFEELPI